MSPVPASASASADGEITIDAELLAPKLGLSAEALKAEMRKGIVSSVARPASTRTPDAPGLRSGIVREPGRWWSIPTAHWRRPRHCHIKETTMSSHPTDFQGSIIDALLEAIEQQIANSRPAVNGGGGHFGIEVTSRAFAGKHVREQWLVYGAIAHLMGDASLAHAVDSL